jgi:hypothetical protein
MQDLTEITLQELPIGYNDKLPSHGLPNKFCTLIQNGFLDSRKIIERNGYTMIANDTAENKPNLLLYPHETPSHKHLLKINDNAGGTAANLFYWNGSGNWVKVASPTFTAGAVCSAATGMGKTYITNGIDTVKSWDGTTLTNVASFPVTKYVRYFHDYMWAMNNSSFKNRVYFSDRDDPETWGVSNFMDISANDGDVTTGFGAMRDELVFAKQYKLYSFQGWTEVSFSVSAVNDKLGTYGATSNLCFSDIGNDLLFMSYGGNIPHIRSLQQTKLASMDYGGVISDDIEGTMNGLSKAQLGKAASVFDGRRVWFFLPTGSSSFNDVALNYDTITKGWSKHTGIYAARGCVSSCTGVAKVYFADSRNSKVYVFDTSTSDNGAAIDFQFITREYEPSHSRLTKFKYLFVEYGTGINSNLLVYCQPDATFNWDLMDTIPLTGQSLSVFPMTFPFSFSNKEADDWRVELPYAPLHSTTFKFAKNDTKEPVTIFMYNLWGRLKPIRDFDTT